MCHHYKGSRNPPEHLRDEFSIRANLSLAVQGFFDGWDAYPLSTVPIVNADRELVAAQWGLLPRWFKGDNPRAFQRKTFNARSEEVDKKPTYRDAFKRRRCLMPAVEFEEKKRYFHLPDYRLFAFAGLWEQCGDLVTCTMLTTRPGEAVAAVHHRQPVILMKHQYAEWLDPERVERSQLEHLFVPVDGLL